MPKGAKPRTSRPKGSESVVFVYCSPAQKVALERAAAKLVEAVPDAKLPTYKFVLRAALGAAKAMGIEVEE